MKREIIAEYPELFSPDQITLKKIENNADIQEELTKYEKLQVTLLHFVQVLLTHSSTKISKCTKVGILLCKGNQITESEMFCNGKVV
jgi:hypothetical protein